MPGTHEPIPLCNSEFLQDFTLALGRRSLKSIRQQYSHLGFEVSFENGISERYERLDIEARGRGRSLIKITLWEDGAAWLYYRDDSGKQKAEQYANLKALDSEKIADLVRLTLREFSKAEEIWKQHRW